MTSTIKTAFNFLLFFFAIVSSLTAEEITLSSPDKKLEIRIALTDVIKYSIYKEGTAVILPSQISLTLENNFVLGVNVKLSYEKRRTVNELLKPLVRQKFEIIKDNFNETTLSFEGDYSLTFRAYNDGIAYRFGTNINRDILVYAEQAEFNFGKDYKMFFPEETSFHSHSEREYLNIPISQITSKRFCSLPALVELENNVKVAITEADLQAYAGMYLTGSDKNSRQLVGLFPRYSLRDSVKGDRNLFVAERADYIARTNGRKDFPWRVIAVSEKDGDLIESTLIYKLAKPADNNSDFSWVKPGKVAWDWWNANNIYGVDFRAGINTQTYKYYIDFASKYGIEYIILDEGWYKLGNLLQVVPDMNIAELVSYGKEKNVGVILWVSWLTLNDQLEEALNQFVKWGVVGIKVDFMQRDDQWMVNYYYKIAREAAKENFSLISTVLTNQLDYTEPTRMY